MGYYLTIWWSIWWIGATLLAVGLIQLNVFRRRRLALKLDEFERAALPKLREEILWAALVFFPGGICLGIMFLLLPAGHTARSLLLALVVGLFMLLGLAMLLKNGLAPTDTIGLHLATPDSAASEPEQAEKFQEIEFEQRLRLRSGPMI